MALSALANIDAWLAYDDVRELCTEIGARVLIALPLTVLLATAVAVPCFPFILCSKSPSQLVDAMSRVGAAVTALICCCAVVGIVIRWSLTVNLISITNRASILLWDGLSVLMVLSAAAWYLRTPQRETVTRRLANSLSSRTTRRSVLAAGLGGLLTGFASRLDPRPRSQRAVTKARESSPNIVLVTFDALCAEDMSCYGYGLPTTPFIDSLARSSHVFSNFYTTSTFTTPCVVSMLTGRYPSSTHVYNYGARLPADAASRTLPQLLHAGGYSTGASVANPGAHPDCLGFGGHFDILPPAPILDTAMRDSAAVFRSGQLAAAVSRDANFVPYMLEQLSPRRFGQVHSTFPPELSFRQAEQILQKLPSPFFLWIHVFAPHFPYLPDPPFLYRFLRGQELRTHAEFVDMMDLKGFMYSPAKQSAVDKARLRYDEWIAQSDAAFGQFVASLQSSGLFDEVALVVSSDHGESFSGGFVGHGGAQQLRPIVHVPLIVHLPGQTRRYDIGTVADQTALSPTLLEIAGLAAPDWMEGKALSFTAGQSATSGEAFTQYLSPNRAFGPIEHGTVGVIDGRRQYVFDLDVRAGSLFDLAQAHEQRANLAQAQPQIAEALQADIRARFPSLMGAS